MTTTELTHYGVPGMKWGVRKHRANDRISRAGNSKGWAIATEAGKALGLSILANSGAIVLNTVTKNNRYVVAGTTLAATAASLTLLVKGIINSTDIARTDRVSPRIIVGGSAIDVKRD